MVTHYTWVEDGRLMAPVDQRTGATVTPPTYAPGQAVPCLVEEAHDWDTLVTPSSQTPEADSVSSYQWSCSRGTFENGGVGPSATWIAPDDITQDTEVTLTCTLDDPPGDRVNAPETGSHDDAPLVRTCTVHVAPPVVVPTGEVVGPTPSIRACAGGIDDHDATDPNPTPAARNDFQYRAHTRQVTLSFTLGGQPLANAPVTLQFSGNKGHDYGDGRSDDDVLFARLHPLTGTFAPATWRKTLPLTTDAGGTLAFWVKSSDVICTPHLLVLYHPSPDPDKPPLTIANIPCAFAQAKTFRNFPVSWESGDNGWIVDFPALDAPYKQTPAKVYLKFKVYPDEPDNYIDENGHGNWQFVEQHHLRLRLDGVDLNSDASYSGSLPDYASLCLTNTFPQNSVLTMVDKYTVSDGSTPQIYVQAGELVTDASSIYIVAEDKSQFEK